MVSDVRNTPETMLTVACIRLRLLPRLPSQCWRCRTRRQTRLHRHRNKLSAHQTSSRLVRSVATNSSLLCWRLLFPESTNAMLFCSWPRPSMDDLYMCVASAWRVAMHVEQTAAATSRHILTTPVKEAQSTARP